MGCAVASVIRTAKIFRNGGSRAIRLPKEFDLSGNEVVLKQDFGVITILPKRARKGSLLKLLQAIGPIELAPRDQPGWIDRRVDRALRMAEKRTSTRRDRQR
jgi:virulence-associated protein VagC